MPRLGHKKSRNGCEKCKARHIKCDENKPCSSCARHGVQCSLVTWDPDAPAETPVVIKRENSAGPGPTRLTKSTSERSTKGGAQAPTPALPIHYVLNPSPASTAETIGYGSPYTQPDPFPYLAKFTSKCDSIQPNYWVRDLELMHHWTTEAIFTISQSDEIKRMWQMDTPKQAISHHFLMHELLAFSAFHMAYLQPPQRRAFYALGTHHQDLAIRDLRRVLPNMSTDNAGAVLATSVLVTLSVFAATGLDTNNGSPKTTSGIPVDDLLDIFVLIQGVSSVMASGASAVIDGPFKYMTMDSTTELPPQPQFEHLLSQIPLLETFISSQSSLSLAHRQEYHCVLSSFKDVLVTAMAPASQSRELKFLFQWPIELSQTFLNLMRQKEPAALAVIGYYALGLFAAESNYWFMEGWAERTIRAVYETVDASWREVLQWPLNHIVGTEKDI